MLSLRRMLHFLSKTKTQNSAARMHMLCVVLLLASLVLCQSSSADEHWDKWKIKYEKVYDHQTEVYRRTVWEENLKLVQKHNQEASAGEHSFTMRLNHLSDMTAEEVNEKLNGFKVEEDQTVFGNWTFKQASGRAVPQSVDWRKKGLVGPVRNQGFCGSCWAFSAVGALEGQMKKQTGDLVPLSPQNLMDCSTTDGNHGCRGGYIHKAFEYIQRNEGIDSEKTYPYEHQDLKCRYSVLGKAGHCSGFKVLPRGDEKTLQAVVAEVGPVSVSVNAGLPSFHHYRGGVYNVQGCNPRLTNHAVLVVGYGTDAGEDFWLVKNSWGAAWGEGGFIRFARNKRNLCGIGNFAIYPTV